MSDARTTPHSIRAATPADVPDILRLIRELAAYEKLEHLVAASEAMLHEALFGTRPSAETLVAQDSGRTVGFALFYTTFSTFLGRPGLHLEDLFVEPAQRGRGIGKALLARLAAIAAHRGCGRLEWHVLDWNEPSIRFYESLGATLMKEWVLVRMTAPELRALAGRDAPPAGDARPLSRTVK